MKIIFPFMAISLSLVFIIGSVFVTYFWKESKKNRKEKIITTGEIIASELSFMNPNSIYFSESIISRIIEEKRYLIVNKAGTVVYDSNGYDKGKLYANKEIIDGLNGIRSFKYLNKEELGVATVPIINAENSSVSGVVIVMDSLADIKEASIRMVKLLIKIIFISLILAFVVAFFVSSKIVTPFNKLTLKINRVIEGHFEEIEEVKDLYEINKIIHSINHMLIRLKSIEANHSEFVANVSHELKTPLSSMKVLSDSLINQKGIPEELYQEFLTDISQEVDRATHIINDLLELSKIEQKDVLLNASLVSINELVESVMKRLKPIADKKNIEMFFESRREIKAEVNSMQIMLALTNIIENGIKYNKENGYIKAYLDSDYMNFHIRIEDTGIGMPQESLDKIFSRFYRVDKTRSRDTGGTGLGLAISKQIIIGHKGKVTCESIINEGSKFFITLPLKQKGLKLYKESDNNENSK